MIKTFKITFNDFTKSTYRNLKRDFTEGEVEGFEGIEFPKAFAGIKEVAVWVKNWNNKVGRFDEIVEIVVDGNKYSC